jgi:hypothetical protein
MLIKLTGALPARLKDLKLKAGDKFNAQPAPNGYLGAVQFQVEIDDEFHIVTVNPENYIKIG